MAFDPYHKWLGIAPREQPPHAYRLLAIDLFESDPDVIDNAVYRQMAHVRTFAIGPHSEMTQKILNEIAQAKTVLLDAQKKAAYDAKLRARLAQTGPPAPPAAQTGATRLPRAEPLPVAQPLEPVSRTAASPIAAPTTGRSPVLWYAAGGTAVVLTGLILAFVLSRSAGVKNRGGNDQAKAGASSSGPTTTPKAAPRTQEGLPSTPPRATSASSPENGTATPVAPAESDPSAADAPQVNAHPPGEQELEADLPEAPTIPAKPETRPEPRPSTTPLPQPGEEVVPPATPGNPSKKRPVPSDDEVQQARATVQELYQEKMRRSQKPDAKLELARELLEQGRQTNDDPAARYVLWCEATRWAADGGDATLALQVIEELAEEFDVAALPLKAEALVAVQKTARQPEQRLALARAASALVEDAMAADDFETARRWSQAAQGASRKLRDAELTKFVAAQAKEVTEQAKAFEAVAQSAAALSRDPGDAAANLAMGGYQWFVKGSLENALPLLARGNDSRLREAAAADLERPDEPQAQAALGDRWWELAEQAKGREGRALRERAAHWYDLAAAKLTGLAKTKVEGRLQQIASQGATSDGFSKKQTNVKGMLYVLANEDFQLTLNGKSVAAGNGKQVSVPLTIRAGEVLAARLQDTSYDYGILVLFVSDDRKGAVTSNVYTWKCFQPRDAERWWDFKPATEHPNARLGNHISMKIPEAAGWGLDAIAGSAKELGYVYHVIDAEELNDAPATQRAAGAEGKLKTKGQLHFVGSDVAELAINGQPASATVCGHVSLPLTVAVGDLLTVKVTITQYGRGFRAVFDSEDHKVRFFTHARTWRLYMPQNPQRWWKMTPRPTDPPVAASDEMELAEAQGLPCQPIGGPKPTAFLYHVVAKEELQPRGK